MNAIVRFLDYLNIRVSRYMAVKKKMIDLLNEQKQAIIHCAVTRGLDPTVRLKASGVNWLGDVPAHWEVEKLQRCGQIIGGLTPSMEISGFWGGVIPWVTPKDMKRFYISSSQLSVTNLAIKETGLRQLATGSNFSAAFSLPEDMLSDAYLTAAERLRRDPNLKIMLRGIRKFFPLSCSIMLATSGELTSI